MKLILENWRGFLKEGIDPRIQKQLDRLLASPDMGISIAPVKEYDADARMFIYVTREDGKWRELTTSRGTPFGVAEIMEPNDRDTGPCDDAWIVVVTQAEKGWGPLLYEVALEWASQHANGLTADRAMVSDSAWAVWAKYMKRGDVKADQLDIFHDPAAYAYRDPDDPTFPQLTPDDESDDCEQVKSVEVGGEKYWMDQPTAKAYKKGSSEVMDALRAAGRLVGE